MAKQSSDEAASAAEQKVRALEDELTQNKAVHEQALLKQIEQAGQDQRQLEVCCLVFPMSIYM